MAFGTLQSRVTGPQFEDDLNQRGMGGFAVVDAFVSRRPRLNGSTGGDACAARRSAAAARASSVKKRGISSPAVV